MRKNIATASKSAPQPRLRAVPPVSAPRTAEGPELRGALPADASHEQIFDYVDELVARFAASAHAADADLSLVVCFLDAAIDLDIDLVTINSDGISRVANKLLRTYKDEHEALTTTLGALWCWFAEARS